MSLNDIKVQTLRSVVGDDKASINTLEKEFWENYTGGGGRPPITPVTKPYVLTAEAVGKVLAKGTAPDSGFVNGLSEGWWFVPGTSNNIKGKPPGVAGNFVVQKQLLADETGQNRGVMFAYGTNSKGKEAMWVRHKTTSKWSDWYEYESGEASIISDEAKTRLDSLEAFRTAEQVVDRGHAVAIAANRTLIDALTTKVASGLTIDEVKAALIKEGWGPLPKHGGGGTKPTGWSAANAQLKGAFADDWAGLTSTTVDAKGGDITLTRSGSAAQYAFVALNAVDAAHVSSFRIEKGLPAQWESKVVNIQGVDYTVFKSPYKFTKTPLDIETEWK